MSTDVTRDFAFGLPKAELHLHLEGTLEPDLKLALARKNGVDIDEAGEGRRFRVENSWGEDHGDKGFFTMDAAWFDANVFEVAVHVDDLPEELRAVIAEEPTHLPAWDPMGALA